ncbi:hypothetical protein [Billgrantia ethanolica]|uniref:Uncharacterized protein n=1 Tax=Billgrantia ethanolica TaxID=2733486 RepID=A0ABS9A4J5_9GAMM|nr:hypothetical protein [Halomonas ethanolica]MCE8002724.1 hypothetical protein [Halomonas ethanolica]
MANVKCNGSQKKPPRGAAKKILEMSREGLSKAGIARGLGCSPKLLNAWLDSYPELQNALDEGRELEHTELRSSLMQQARGGNVTAAIFLLKCRHGYREGDQGDLANRVSVTFNLPGPMKLEDFSNVIEGESHADD